jgi:glycosyltransferase involved in cell wall biosynthesis
MPAPLVTVIIPTYNRSAALPYAIGSVLDQTMRDFELLVVGDGCTDDSAEVVAAIGDPRVRWINLPANVGHQAAPNNRGLEEARGEFVAYLGHDDLWLAHHLQCTTDALRQSGAGVAHSLLMNVSPGQPVGMPVMPLPGVGSAPSCAVYRRSVTGKIGGWRDYRRLDVSPEVDLFRRAEAAGFETAFVPRLSAIKFPALTRKDVYRDNPCHEQSLWLQRIRSDPDFEATYLARMIASDQAVRAVPMRRMLRLFAQALKERLAWRMTRRSGYKAILWMRRGAGIDLQKRYKGLQ